MSALDRIYWLVLHILQSYLYWSLSTTTLARLFHNRTEKRKEPRKRKTKGEKI